jgi:Na+/melibiose symporter-like transporter
VSEHPEHATHVANLIQITESVLREAGLLRAATANLATAPADLERAIGTLREKTTKLKQQPPSTLFRLRLFEIGVPLVLSIFSIVLTLRYPLTEARCYEIKDALTRRRAESTT